MKLLVLLYSLGVFVTAGRAIEISSPPANHLLKSAPSLVVPTKRRFVYTAVAYLVKEETAVLIKLRRFMFPLCLSKALEVVVKLAIGRDAGKPDWYSVPVHYLIEVAGDKPIAEISPDDIKSWLHFIQSRISARTGKPLSPYTIDSYKRALRAFFNHLVKMGHLSESPANNLKQTRLPAKRKKDIPQGDIDKMVKQSRRNLRDNAIVLVLRDSGCRVSELVSMRLSLLRLEEGYKTADKFYEIDDEAVAEKLRPIVGEGEIRWRGKAFIETSKTDSARYIFFGHEATCALRAYLDIRPVYGGDHIWLNRSGHPLKRSGVYQMLKRVARECGVSRFNPHAFRHALVKRLMSDGMPVRVIQELLGHSDLTTTMSMYVQLDDRELQDFHSSYSD